MPSRIVQIVPTLDRAGAEKQLSLLSTGLPSDEFEVHICALTRGGPLAGPLEQAGLPVTVIGKRWKLDLLSFGRLKRYLRRLSPSLVHTWIFAAGAYGRAAALSSGVDKLVAGERCVDKWKSGWQWHVDRRLAQRTNRLVANSPAIRDYCVSHGLPAERFAIIPNGVESPRASDVSRADLLRELRVPPDARLIGAIGRLWPQKRVKELIWAADLIRVLHDEMRLLVIGDGPQRAQLERFARLASDLDHVRFLGARDDLWRIVPHLDVLWQASGYEGQPNAVMEAMAAGVPVVASDIPGHRELIADGQSGFLVPVAARAARVRLTDQLLQDADLARRLGEAGQQRMRQDFSVSQMVASYADLYRAVLAE